MGVLRSVARAAVAHWFFGNLYEEVVEVPELVAATPPGGVLAWGSPARYYLLVAPVTVGSVVALATTERTPRRLLKILGVGPVRPKAGLGRFPGAGLF